VRVAVLVEEEAFNEAGLAALARGVDKKVRPLEREQVKSSLGWKIDVQPVRCQKSVQVVMGRL
jgi:hypothetical protein